MKQQMTELAKKQRELVTPQEMNEAAEAVMEALREERAGEDQRKKEQEKK